MKEVELWEIKRGGRPLTGAEEVFRKQRLPCYAKKSLSYEASLIIALPAIGLLSKDFDCC